MGLRFSLVAALAAASLALSAAVSSGETAAVEATAKASANGITVIVPGASGGSAASVAAPPDAAMGGSLAYPSDGSAVQAPSVTASVLTTNGPRATGTASVDASSVSLFGGEITLASAAARAKATVKGWSAVADVSGSSVQGLVVLGQPVEAARNGSMPVGDWGQISVLEQSTEGAVTGGRNGLTTSMVAVRVRLTKEHGGLPAGSEIVIGRAEATAEPPPPDVAKVRPTSRTSTVPPRTTRPRPVTTTRREPGRNRPKVPLLRRAPPVITPPLTAGGYVFPVYGPTSWADSFGAPRAAPVGWHHGQDIFAALGAPILAVADGTLFSVGWNDLGGYRLWLQDAEGNEFYYAHLSAFSTLAFEGAQVKAGDVIGFVGSTGDAEGTPFHLHFEIHPVSLKSRGYDESAVNPTTYLLAWQKLEDVPIVGVAGWAAPIAPESRAPRPGAILLQVTDIASASGLEPGSLRRVLRAPRSLTADGGLASVRRSATGP